MIPKSIKSSSLVLE